MTELERRSSRFPTAGDVTEVPAESAEVHPGAVLVRQLRLSQARAEWLGDKLREQIEREGVAGMVGDTIGITADGAPVRLSEYARQLGEIEHRERATAAGLARQIAHLGIESQEASASSQRQQRMVSTLARVLCEEVGMDWSDPATRRTAQRAMLRTREELA